MTSLLDRFLTYVQIDTQSREGSETFPSTPGQWELLRKLEGELRELGVADLQLTDSGYVLAQIPGNSAKAEAKTIALLAHVDTARDYSGTNVKPLVHENYSGKPIVLPEDPTKVLDPEKFAYLNSRIGDTIITASGDTLLGADDKAGVAVIMTVVERLLTDDSIKHGPVRICFNPDEEVGLGMHKLPLEQFKAHAAYTIDGGERGALVFETFSADRAVVTIKGVSIHPGSAKGEMVNAVHLAGKLLAALPREGLSPETTEGREGFIHPYSISGNAAETVIRFILRDFEPQGLEDKGLRLQGLCRGLNAAEPRASISCEIEPQYRNMRYWLEKDMRPVDFARRAYERCGVSVVERPTRGGTDGSHLTEAGLPTPNVFCGMQNIHGPLEWVSLQDMQKSVDVVLELLKIWESEG